MYKRKGTFLNGCAKISIGDKMEYKVIEKNLKKKELQELLTKIKNASDSFSIARYYEGNMSKEEFECMQQQFKDMIEYEHQKRIKDYENNVEGYQEKLNQLFHFCSLKEAMPYFEELYNQELNVYKSCQYCEFEGYEEEVLEIPDDFLIKREMTRITPVTIGPVFEVLTFSIKAFDVIGKSMKKLFSQYNVFGSEFEDLCFYKNGKVVFAICSHEGYAVFYDDCV